MTEPSHELDLLCINTLRALSIDAVQAANSGHPGMPLGAAPMAHALWSRHLRFDPQRPEWPNRDRFVLSAGHGSMLLYSLLHMTGFDVPLEELKQFRQLGSITPGHPENKLTPGVEMATGPLGQGLATAVGMALAERFLAARFNRPSFEIFDHFTFVIASDGDLMEGVAHEAASLAGHQKLGKLIVLYDDNGITIDGRTHLAFSEDVPARFAALGWHTQSIDGMDVAAVDTALLAAKTELHRPSLIAAKTVIGFGSPNKADSSKSHGAPLGVDEVVLTKRALGIPEEPLFWRSPEAMDFYRQLGAKGAAGSEAWTQLLQKYRDAHLHESELLDVALSGRIPDIDLPKFPDSIQTRQASGKCLQRIATSLPTFLGGSADLAESNQTLIEGEAPMQAEAPQGRNIYFGVREHAMAAAVNGMNLHGGVRAFAASFLIFSDYCRPSIRLAALMGCPSIFVFTHDSIGVGEDGPTHQPIEHYAAFRAMPNLNFMRPADGNETAACWHLALERQDGPSLLALTRQAVPSLTPAGGRSHPARRGAYVLLEGEGRPDVTLLATGSEVSLAVESARRLAQDGIAARVVSMPSWFLFEQQPDSYRKDVLGTAPRISIEAGATLGWERYASLCIGLDRFGESAPHAKLLEHFGLTPDAVAERVRRHVREGALA